MATRKKPKAKPPRRPLPASPVLAAVVASATVEEPHRFPERVAELNQRAVDLIAEQLHGTAQPQAWLTQQAQARWDRLPQFSQAPLPQIDQPELFPFI